MKKTVTIVLEIDTDEYDEPLETSEQLEELVMCMLDGDTDFPETAVVSHGQTSSEWRWKYPRDVDVSDPDQEM